jgi:hypothetical protein
LTHRDRNNSPTAPSAVRSVRRSDPARCLSGRRFAFLCRRRASRKARSDHQTWLRRRRHRSKPAARHALPLARNRGRPTVRPSDGCQTGSSHHHEVLVEPDAPTDKTFVVSKAPLPSAGVPCSDHRDRHYEVDELKRDRHLCSSRCRIACQPGPRSDRTNVAGYAARLSAAQAQSAPSDNYRSSATNPACSKCWSWANASARPRSRIRTKEAQSVRLHSLSLLLR